MKVRRRDRPGHIDPQYAAELLKMAGRDVRDEHAFVAHARSNDAVAESLGEEFVEAVTGAEYADYLDEATTEEVGGPFLVSPANKEFAHGTDASNPKNSTREPFPKT
jgi:hypothetical protein